MGRHTKLTPERQQKICELLKAGNTARTAALANGICEATLINWMNKGRKQKSGKYFEFFEAIKKAKAEAEARNVLIIQKAAEKNWQAAAWWLERTNPDKWGRRLEQKIEHSGKVHIDVFKKYLSSQGSQSSHDQNKNKKDSKEQKDQKEKNQKEK